MHAGEERVVLPSGEHPLAGHVRQVDLTLDPVVVAEPDPVRLQRAHLDGTHSSVARRHEGSLPGPRRRDLTTVTPMIKLARPRRHPVKDGGRVAHPRR